MQTIFSRNFVALILSVAIVGLGMGATLPLTALALTDAGHSVGMVGFMTAMQATGSLVVIFKVRFFTERFNAQKIISYAVLSVSLATVLMQFTTQLWVWATLRVISGAALMLLFVISETWVNELTNETNRARLIAVYTTVFTSFQMAGPVLVGAIAAWQATRFIICGSVFVFALPALILLRAAPTANHCAGADRPTRGAPSGLRHIAPLMPAILVGTAFFAIFDTLALSLMPLFAMSYGVPANLALLFGSALLLGDTLMQFPIGWLADRVGRKRVHIGASLVVIGLLPLLPFALSNPWFCWPLLFVIGAAAGAIYTLSLVACGERFRGAALMSASALVGASWSVASLSGSLATGVLMDAFAPVALIGVLHAGAVAFLITLVWERRISSIFTSRLPPQEI